jgi:hypothetical protein
MPQWEVVLYVISGNTMVSVSHSLKSVWNLFFVYHLKEAWFIFYPFPIDPEQFTDKIFSYCTSWSSTFAIIWWLHLYGFVYRITTFKYHFQTSYGINDYVTITKARLNTWQCQGSNLEISCKIVLTNEQSILVFTFFPWFL